MFEFQDVGLRLKAIVQSYMIASSFIFFPYSLLLFAGEENPPTLSVVAVVSKNTFVEYEPIFVELIVTNMSSAEQEVPLYFRFKDLRDYGIKISGDAGVSELKLLGLNTHGPQNRPVRMLKPGQQRHELIPIHFNPMPLSVSEDRKLIVPPQAFPLAAPGRYTVSVALKPPHDAPFAKSVLLGNNEIPLFVVKTDEKYEREKNLFAQIWAVAAVTEEIRYQEPWGSPKMKKFCHELEEVFVNSDKDSPYRPWMLWILGQFHIVQKRERSRAEGRVRPSAEDADFQSAVKMFDELTSCSIPYLRERSSVMLANLCAEVDDRQTLSTLLAVSAAERYIYQESPKDIRRFWFGVVRKIGGNPKDPYDDIPGWGGKTQ